MCDVTRHNFAEVFPKIQKSIKNCNFIAVDTEFSALSLDDAHSPRYVLVLKIMKNYEKCFKNYFNDIFLFQFI